MIKILNENTSLIISPYERVGESAIKQYNHIKVWVEFTTKNLRSHFTAEYIAGDLKVTLINLKNLYQSVTTQTSASEVSLLDAYHQVKLRFVPNKSMDDIGLELTLHPEEDDEGIKLHGGIAIDQSYLPSIIHGLSEILDYSN